MSKTSPHKVLQVLHLPKWYPNKFDPFDGNFIENYLVTLQAHGAHKVLFVHADANLKQAREVILDHSKGFECCSIYFKKHQSWGPLSQLINAYRYFKSQQQGFKKLYPNSHPDLCHVHVLARSAFFAFHLKLRLQIPFVISEHWSGYLPQSNAFKGVFKKASHRFLVKQAAAVHTVSTNLKTAMLRHGLNSHYHVIPNVVDEQIFRPVDETRISEKTQVLFVGNLLQNPKKILNIIETAAEIEKEYPHFELLIYGEGVDEEKCRQLIKEKNAQAFIHLKGTLKRKEIAKEMAKANFLILNSFFENQPCVINESLSAGTPVVAPNIEGIVEFTNEETALLFQRNDEAAFKAAFLEMLQTYQQYDQTAIRDFAVKHFSEGEIAAQFNHFYQSALTHV